MTRQTALRIAALLDLPGDGLTDGAVLPQAWSAVLFGPLAPHSQIGPDGHPRRGDFLPPVALPRRMFAGRRTTFQGPLHIGDEVERVSEIAKVEAKDGRSGRMIFVTVVHRLRARGAPVLTEEQDIVYRDEIKPGGAPTAPARDAPPTAAWSRTVVPDPVMVFRYSAITYNGHRIHYDADYTRDVEGYPACVVNGGLTTLLTLELARAKLDRPLAAVATRNVKPLFVGRPITVCGTTAGERAELWVLDDGGALALKASAELAR
ncbi:MAG: MaoC family dehydratase N-terminal domain-containing protein [Proteobacteria bacterium]|nr:MaoC family dehydratase N-terminal domain-containing protein [Pseudomonadota bacterium]